MGKRGLQVYAIETTIDDMNPQVYDHVMERLMKAGALEVTLQPVQAKKNRPAVILRCLALRTKMDAICDLILKETTTFGVRYYPVERKILQRKLRTVTVRRENIRVKMGFDERGKLIKQVPEYEDVKRIAQKTQRSLYDIINESMIIAIKSKSK